MKAILIHPRGPGQFLRLAPHLAARGWDVTLLSETVDRHVPDVRIVRHRAERARRDTSALARNMAVPEHHIRVGYKVAETLDALARNEGRPDVIFGHIGWGSMLFAKDVLPTTPMLGYCEYFFRAEGGDVGFDPHEPVTLDDRQRLRLRNLGQLVTLDAIDASVSPTRWQRSRYPKPYRETMGLCHDGVDTVLCRPNPSARLKLPSGRVLRHGDPVVTYAARDLEPYRGFPQFMRAAAMVARRRPDAVFVVAGGDGVSYGRPSPDGRSWRDIMLDETGIDPDRVVFLGKVPHSQLLALFQISAAHVYLTYPFVLSWSVLEAMSCGAPVIGSATPPVREVLADGVNGLLADFFDPDALAGTIREALDHPERMRPLRSAARTTVMRRFALASCLQRQTSALEKLAGRQGRPH